MLCLIYIFNWVPRLGTTLNLNMSKQRHDIFVSIFDYRSCN